jgi:hypothetical protein
VPPVGGTEELGNELKITEKLKKVNDKLACVIHAGSYCLIPNKNTGPVFLKYGLPLEHLRIVDSERRAWAEELVSMTRLNSRQAC